MEIHYSEIPFILIAIVAGWVILGPTIARLVRNVGKAIRRIGE